MGDYVKFSNMELRPHQVDFLDKFFSPNCPHGMCAVHPTGSGKTFLAIAIAENYLLRNPGSNVVFCSPKSLLANMAKEMKKVGGVRDIKRYRFYTLKKFYLGFLKNEMNVEEPEEDIDDEPDDDCNFGPDDFIEQGQYDPSLSSNFNLEGSLFMIDEAHNLKTEIVTQESQVIKGKMAYVYIKASAVASKVFMATATPLVNYISDLANLVTMMTHPSLRLKTRIVGTNDIKDWFTREEFENIFYGDREFTRDLVGGKFDFHEMDEGDKSEYPSVSYRNEFLIMPPKLYKHYIAQEKYLYGKEVNVLEDDFFQEKLPSFFTGIRMAANLTPEEIELATVKATWIKEFVRSWIVRGVLTRRFIIYSQYVKWGVKLIVEQLEKCGIECGVIIGTSTEAQRAETVAQYNTHRLNILVISKCGREGLDTKATDYVIINENAWNISTEQQVVGRAVRRLSHQGYPRKHVEVIRLLMTKPEEYDYGPVDIIKREGNFNHLGQYKSADLLLMSISLRKLKILDATFETMKKYNTEINTTLDGLKLSGDMVCNVLNEYIWYVLLSKFYISSRVPSEGTDDRLLAVTEPTTFLLELPMFSFDCRPCTVTINAPDIDGSSSGQTAISRYAIYLRGYYSKNKYNINLIINMGIHKQFALDHIKHTFNSVVSGYELNQDVLEKFYKGYRSIGPYILIKNKINYANYITTGAYFNQISKRPRTKLLSILNTSAKDNFLSFGNWSNTATLESITISSNNTKDERVEKTVHVLDIVSLKTKKGGTREELLTYSGSLDSTIESVLKEYIKELDYEPYCMLGDRKISLKSAMSTLPDDAILRL